MLFNISLADLFLWHSWERVTDIWSPREVDFSSVQERTFNKWGWLLEMLNFLLLVMFKPKPGAYHRPSAHLCVLLPPTLTAATILVGFLNTWHFLCHVHVFFYSLAIALLNLEVKLAKQAPGLLSIILPPVFHLLALSSHSSNTGASPVTQW